MEMPVVRRVCSKETAHPPAQVWMSYAAFEAAPLPLPEDEEEDEDEAAAAERQAAAQSGDEAPANREARARRCVPLLADCPCVRPCASSALALLSSVQSCTPCWF